jgi:hypothetical protein
MLHNCINNSCIVRVCVGEVTNNSTHIIGMHYSYQALSLTRLNLGAGAAVPLAKTNLLPPSCPQNIYR